MSQTIPDLSAEFPALRRRIVSRIYVTAIPSAMVLSDTSHRTLYTFPAIILVPDETITVYTGHVTLNTTALFMDRDEPVWGNEGDLAILKDGTGTLIDQRSEG